MSWDISGRKKSHVDICMKEDVSYHKTTGLENYEFEHVALPDINFEDIDTSTSFLGKTLTVPLIISGMTGGPKLSLKINSRLASAAQKYGIAMGVGSQRIALEKDEKKGFDIRKFAPDVLLFANIGAIQLNNGYGIEECNQAVKSIGADALMLHLNPMQEVIQQGETNFEGLIDRIKDICSHLQYPVVVKEVGFGMSRDVGSRLKKAGVSAIDVSGSGGTSWTAVESYMAKPPFDDIGRLFWDWGIPTAHSIEMNKKIGIPLIAGGGIRNGLEMAKAVALGADYVSMAGPFLKAALKGEDAVSELITGIQLALKTVMFGIGAKNIEELKGNNALYRKP